MPDDATVVTQEIFIEDLVVRGFTEYQIYAEARKKHQLDWASIRKYINRAILRIEHRCFDPSTVAETRARLRVRMQQFEKAKAWSALAKVEELAARIDGAIAPTTHNINVQSSMTPELAQLFQGHVARATGALDTALRELLGDEDLRLRILARAGEIVAASGALPEPATKALAFEDESAEDDGEDEGGPGDPAAG